MDLFYYKSEDFNYQHVAKKLIKKLPKEKEKIWISGISTDSKKIKKDLFFLQLKEISLMVKKFIDEAIANGAVVVICSKECKYKKDNVLILRTLNIRFF